MLERLRQSLALRLAIQYALVFAVGAAVLFSALYLFLADALESRDRAAVERRVSMLAETYELGGLSALRADISQEASPEVRSYFVRVLGPGNETVFASVPPDWIETSIEKFPLPSTPGLTATRETHSIRIPQSALRDYAIASRPLIDGRLLQVGRSTDSRAVLLAPLRRAFLGLGTGAIALSLLVGTLFAWRSTRPLRAVSETARRIIETGDLAARVPGAGGRGELAVLVAQLNTLLTRNATHVQVLRDTLDNLAHDLRTPLTRLRGTAELALHNTGNPEEAQAALADCINESDRVLHLLEALLDVSAAEVGALQLNRDRIDLRTVLERAADLYREVAEEKNITLTLHAPGVPVMVDADVIRLGQAVSNLVDNALKYTPSSGRVDLSMEEAQDDVKLCIDDSGPGIAESEREAIFRRLYRSDSSRSQRGLGLGLSLARAMVEAQGGTIAVARSPLGGARFAVTLPRASQPQHEALAV
ncbi:MAG: HAMP domain-containing histidine kinase [Opitutaceae bacterium]|nr:HAMP domain-containing histidine kinase [Opitutaceae bacterium]